MTTLIFTPRLVAVFASRRVHPTENVYDIERAVLGYATLIGAPILFERLLSGERPASEHNRGLVIEIVEGHPDGLPN
jgi:hypothetical protein